MMTTYLIFTVLGLSALFVLLFFGMLARWYKKVPQGKALIRTGTGGLKISFNGMFIVPVFHEVEWMDISLKRIEIAREKNQGLICKDNMRADIRVVFFVRVNNNESDVSKVAQSIGCERASDSNALKDLFEAKFSEALKTVGKQFEFIELYNSRDKLRLEILNTIGGDLNGYILDDCAIDFLEQTSLAELNPDNILDSEGIKKIIDLTAKQKIEANSIQNEEKKRIKKQDVEAEETVLSLEQQQVEAEEKQKKAIATIKSREESAAEIVKQEEKLKAEQARIEADKEIEIHEKNRERQVLIAEKNKERTDVLEQEKIEREKQLAENERERIVKLAQIEKEKAIEEEKKNIQEVIRERVIVQKAVVVEEEKIKDTQAQSEAEREKKVALTLAEQEAEEALVQQLKAAEAAKEASVLEAEQQKIEAEAELATATKKAEAIKIMADAKSTEIAAEGLAETQVMEARSEATKKEGQVQAEIIEANAQAEAKGIEMKGLAQADANKKLGEVEAELGVQRGKAEAEVKSVNAEAEAKAIEMKGLAQADANKKLGEVEAELSLQRGKAEAEVKSMNAEAIEKEGLAEAKVLEKNALVEAEIKFMDAQAIEKEGLAEAKVLEKKALVEAQRIEAEANALKAMDQYSRQMEEFKLKLSLQRDIELAKLEMQKELAQGQATVLSSALQSANIDIIGGETEIFDRIVNAIGKGKTIDGLVNSSEVLTDVKTSLLGTGGSEDLIENVKNIISKFGLTSEDIKNLSMAALLNQLSKKAKGDDKKQLGEIAELIQSSGIGDLNVVNFLSNI